MRKANVWLVAAGFAASGCASTPAKPPPAAQLSIYDALTARLTIDDGGNLKAGEMLRDGLRKMLESSTARRLALDYVRDGLPATLAMVKVKGSKMGTYDGRSYLTINAAETVVNDTSTITIRFNELMLKAPDQAPNSIAHELLGHGLDYSRAAKDGSDTAYTYADSAEVNARLVGWTVDQELGDRSDQIEIDDYLSDTTTYMDRHRFDAASYCVSLSRAAMGDALAT